MTIVFVADEILKPPAKYPGVFFQMIEELTMHGKVVLVAPSHEPIPQMSNPGLLIDNILVPDNGFAAKLLFVIKCCYNLVVRHLRSNAVRVVIANNVFIAGAIVAILGKITGKKTLILLRGNSLRPDVTRGIIDALILGALAKISIAFGDKILTVTTTPLEKTVWKMRSKFSHFPVSFWGARIDASDEVDPSRTQCRRCPVVAYIGRLSPEKGADRLPNLFSEIRKRVPDCRFLVVGGGILLPSIRNSIDFDGVEFLSPRPRNEIIEVLRKIDVLVLPSRTEGLSNVVLEAIQLGVHVVATPAGGMQTLRNELLSEGVYLLRTSSIDSLSETVIETLSRPVRLEDRARQSELARLFVSEQSLNLHNLFARLLAT